MCDHSHGIIKVLQTTLNMSLKSEARTKLKYCGLMKTFQCELALDIKHDIELFLGFYYRTNEGKIHSHMQSSFNIEKFLVNYPAV